MCTPPTQNNGEGVEKTLDLSAERSEGYNDLNVAQKSYRDSQELKK
jgi:hypothetical protein